VDQVKIWWQSYQFTRSSSYVLSCKLKALKGDLRIWNNETFGHVGKRKKMLLDDIKKLDISGEGCGLNKEERRSKEELSSELERLLLCEEISWCQKSRALWLREGDKNTKFFHRVANSSKRNIAIESLIINGSLSSEDVVIKAHVQFYTQLYTEKCSTRPTPDGLSFQSIGSEEGLWLEKDFEENEVFYRWLRSYKETKLWGLMAFHWVLCKHVGK
jgi:hypothetical protein